MNKQYVMAPGERDLVRREGPEPKVEPGQVRVAMRAASLNYHDLVVLHSGVETPVVAGSDSAGQVVEVADDVDTLAVGDRVSGLFFPSWLDGPLTPAKVARTRGTAPEDGVLAQTTVGAASSFVKIPDHLSFEEAATLPCAAVTAWHALFETAQPLQAGETVLIQGTGGVALFSLQLARNAGARTIMLSSSDEKLARVGEMGADALINYTTTPDWQHAVLDLTDGSGVDMVVELGGGGTLSRSMEATRLSGGIQIVGVLSGIDGEINPVPILLRNLRLRGIFVGSGAMQQKLQTAMDLNDIHPVIDQVFGFDDAAEAFAHLQSAKHFGKLVVPI